MWSPSGSAEGLALECSGARHKSIDLAHVVSNPPVGKSGLVFFDDSRVLRHKTVSSSSELAHGNLVASSWPASWDCVQEILQHPHFFMRTYKVTLLQGGTSWASCIINLCMAWPHLDLMTGLCSASWLNYVQLCNLMECSLAGFFVHGDLSRQELEWVVMFSPPP